MKSAPILRDPGALVGFTAAMLLLPAFGLYVIAWLLWSAIYADWITVTEWIGAVFY